MSTRGDTLCAKCLCLLDDLDHYCTNTDLYHAWVEENRTSRQPWHFCCPGSVQNLKKYKYYTESNWKRTGENTHEPMDILSQMVYESDTASSFPIPEDGKVG